MHTRTLYFSDARFRYGLAAIWGVSSLQYTHCLPWQTPPTCILSRQPHATTHSHSSDVRPWNTPAGSVVIWLLSRRLLRHTHRVRVVKRLPHACAQSIAALSLTSMHARMVVGIQVANQADMRSCARCTWHNHACLVMANILMPAFCVPSYTQYAQSCLCAFRNEMCICNVYHSCMCTCVCVYSCICMYGSTDLCVCPHSYVRIFMHISACLCFLHSWIQTYITIYRQTHTLQ